MILLTLTVILFSAYRAKTDSNLIKDGEEIHHPLNALLVIIWAITCSWIILHSSLGIPYFLSIYWLLFDMILNKLMGKDLLFVGATAWLDKTFRNIAMKIQDFLFWVSYTFRGTKWILNHFPISPGKVMLIAKVICLGISIGVYIWFKK